MSDGILKRGDEFYTETGIVTVRRVAKDNSWADILVEQGSTGATWTKRQPLVDGNFAFAAWRLLRVRGVEITQTSSRWTVRD
jgi:hypothetical protein